MNARRALAFLGSTAVSVAIALAIFTLAAFGQTTTQRSTKAAALEETSTWQQVGGDPGGSHYSQLNQINTRNVWRLERVWTWRSGQEQRSNTSKSLTSAATNGGASSGTNSSSTKAAAQVADSRSSTPILLPEAAGGALVFCGPGGEVVAVTPDTGREVWRSALASTDLKPGDRRPCVGVSYWRDDKAKADEACGHRVFFVAVSRRLLALDAATGKTCDGFSIGGAVDLSAGAEKRDLADGSVAATYSVPPVVINGIVIVAEREPKGGIDDAAGVLRAYDARTGKLRWALPAPEQADLPAGENAQAAASGLLAAVGAVRSQISVDASRNLLFFATGGASHNGFGPESIADDEYAASIVALRASDGGIAWHFQTVHRDVWNYAPPEQPLLIDIAVNKRRVAVVVAITAQGFVFVLDRATGEPLFPVEERPVPTDGVIAELLSKTQPFPLKPPTLADATVASNEVWGLTFWDENRCRASLNKARVASPFTPPDEPGWISFPGAAGGPRGVSGAYDPETQLLVTNSARVAVYTKLSRHEPLANKPKPMSEPTSEPKPEQWDAEQQLLVGPSGLPCTAPPWSVVTAVDLKTGDIRWRVPLQVPNPILPIPNAPSRLADLQSAQPIVTRGGLVFIGSRAEGRLRAFDTTTGAALWSTPLPDSSQTSAMTFERSGRQFVVVSLGVSLGLVGGAGDGAAKDPDAPHAKPEAGDYLVAYALPQKYLEGRSTTEDTEAP